MFSWALLFLIVAVVAGAFGFGGVAGTAAGFAEMLFYIGLILFVVTLLAGAVRGRAPRL